MVIESEKPNTKIKNRFIDRTSVKNILLGVWVIIIGAICSALGVWDYENDKHFSGKLILLVFFFITYIIMLAYYATREVNINQMAIIMQEQNRAFEVALGGMVSICQQSSQNVNRLIHEIIEEGRINLNIWSFDIQCGLICEKIHNFLCELGGKSRDYYVSYIRLDESCTEEKMAYMCAYYNKNMERPSVFKKRRKIDDPNGYYDVQLFANNNSGIVVHSGHEAINDVFNYEPSDKRQRNRKKYNQYIAIPVICEKENVGKMVGLLEITCLNKTMIANSEDEVKEIASKYLVPYAYFMLLLHKLEKAIIAQPRKLGGGQDE